MSGWEKSCKGDGRNGGRNDDERERAELALKGIIHWAEERGLCLVGAGENRRALFK